MEEGGGQEEGVSFESWPSGEHVMRAATAGRVRGGEGRRLPSVSRGRLGEEEEDFDSLLAAMEGEGEDISVVSVEGEEDVEDAFDSLLKESGGEGAEEEETTRKRSVDDDFNLLLEDNDIKEEELRDKVEIVSTPESSGDEEEDVKIVTHKEGGEKEELSEREDDKETEAIHTHCDNKVETKHPAIADKHSKDEGNIKPDNEVMKPNVKDPFEEMFDELVDPESVENIDEGFQKIFGQSVPEAEAAVIRDEVKGREGSEGDVTDQSDTEGVEEVVKVTEQAVGAEEEASDKEPVKQHTSEEAGEKTTGINHEGVEEPGKVAKQAAQMEANPEGEPKEVKDGLEKGVVVREMDQEETEVATVGSDIPKEATERKVIEIEEVIDEARVRELAVQLARDLVTREQERHREEVQELAREVVGEREVFTDRIDRLEGEVQMLRAQVSATFWHPGTLYSSLMLKTSFGLVL